MPVKSSLEVHEETGECLLIQLCYPDVQRPCSTASLSKHTGQKSSSSFSSLESSWRAPTDWPRHARRREDFFPRGGSATFPVDIERPFSARTIRYKHQLSSLNSCTMTAYLRKPFASCNTETLLARGGGGYVYTISKHVVFKCPMDLHNPAPCQAKEMEESAAKIANEKSTHELLMKHPHPNIVRCILCVPEGFFMERMEATLQTRLDQHYAPSNRTKARWITQIASALSWIEGLGFVHGDLRPANILLTANENIRLADFDTSVKIGEELEAASEPFCKLTDDPELPRAEPISEQFALGSCIYTIRFGHIPLDGLDSPDRIQKLMNDEFPSTENDAEFGVVTLNCWRGQYASVTAAYDDIKARCDGMGYDTESVSDVSEDLIHDMTSLLAECKAFVARERGTGGW